MKPRHAASKSRLVNRIAPLREGMDEAQAAELVWALSSPEMLTLLTVDRVWSTERYSQWLGDTLVRLLLP